MVARSLLGASALLLTAAVLAVLAGALDPRDAWAHGGQIVAPPPPPEPSEPPIPVPPPPPITGPAPIRPPDTPPPGGPGSGPVRPPITPPPTTPPPGAPGSGKPTTPGSTPPGPTPPPTTPPTTGGPTGRTPGLPPRGPGSRAPRSGATAAAPGWALWWTFNRLAWLPGREEIEVRRQSAFTPRTDARLESDERDDMARRTVTPWLLRTLADSRTEPEVTAACLLALAKTSNDALAVASVDRFLREAPKDAVVAESAALAAGLLRRTDTARQASAADLDAVRDRLFEVMDTEHRRWRTRAFAAFALGLLGDQPGGGPPGHEGARTVRRIWERLEGRATHPELDVALVTALGMQPLGCIPTRVREGLKDAALGRRIGGRRWSDRERAHAVAAYARLRAPGWASWTLRVAMAPRVPGLVREAAVLSLGGGAEDVDATSREEFAAALPRIIDRAKAPSLRGLAWLSAGRWIAAGLAASDPLLDNHAHVGRALRNAAENAQVEERTLAALGLALAHRGQHGPRAQEETSALLRERLRSDPGGPTSRAAYAVGLLLLGEQGAAPDLLALLADDATDAGLRAVCALTLGVLGQGDEATRRALATAVFDRSFPEVAGESALALSMLPRGPEAVLLAGRLDDRSSEHARARIAVALGRLGDLRSVDDLLAIARAPRHGDETRALAVAAMGLLVDPEPVPSLVRLSRDAAYPARTETLHEALDIL